MSRQFGDDPDYQLEIWHSPREWSTKSLMERYLQWLSEQFNDDRVFLSLDRFEAHCCDGFVNLTEEIGIRVIWIPKGMTGICKGSKRSYPRRYPTQRCTLLIMNDCIRKTISSSPSSFSKIFIAPTTSAPAFVLRTSMRVCTFQIFLEQ
jgi:hypothetical protein